MKLCFVFNFALTAAETTVCLFSKLRALSSPGAPFSKLNFLSDLLIECILIKYYVNVFMIYKPTLLQ